MEFSVHADEIAKFLEECQQNLLHDLDEYHAAMQEKMQSAYGPPFMEKLMASLEQQQQQQQQLQPQTRTRTQTQTMNESQPALQPQLTRTGATSRWSGRVSAASSRFPSGTSLDVDEYWPSEAASYKDSPKAEKYKNSKVLKQKIRELKSTTTPQTEMEMVSVRGKMASFMQSAFDRYLGFLILANTFVVFAQLEHQSQEVRAALDLDTQSWPHANLIFSVLDYLFCVVFITELSLRLYIERMRFFRSKFNLLDLVVVPLMTIDAVLGELGPQMSVAPRFTRMLRVIRAFQLIRSLSHFRHLRILWNTIASSVAPFVYSMTVMFIFMVILAILLTQTLQHFILDTSDEIVHRQWLYQHYGDGLKSLWTVFELTFSGCWPNYVRPLVEKVHVAYAPLFALYVTVVIFAMSRIISALFLKETLQQASSDTEMMIKEKAKTTGNMEKSLLALFRTADIDSDGMLSEEEFNAILSHDKIQLWLGMLGIDGSDASSLYKQLGGHVGGLSCDTFVYGVKRLKGEARSQDLIPLVNDCKQILRLCEQSRDAWSNLRQTQFPQVDEDYI